MEESALMAISSISSAYTRRRASNEVRSSGGLRAGRRRTALSPTRVNVCHVLLAVSCVLVLSTARFIPPT